MLTFVWLVFLIWVLFGFGAIGFAWIWHLRLRRALQWWWKRQVTQAYENAEQLRNHALQESFALRRHLELIGMPHPSETTLNLWQAHMPLLLEGANRLHREVQCLSDQLSSPFLEDSLLLAIRHGIAAWKEKYPTVTFSLDLPDKWEIENEVQQDILTKVLDECLRLFLAESLQTEISQDGEKREVAIALNRHQNWNYLRVQMIFPPVFTSTIRCHWPYFRYLGYVFQTLMPGRYTLKLAPHTLSFEGRWKSL